MLWAVFLMLNVRRRFEMCSGTLMLLRRPIDRLETYQRFQPDDFDRRRINRRLKQWAEDNKMCISE
jgi:hypothetical protein